MATGGIVLLDEPELHLNPSVCSKIIPFLDEHLAITNDLQIIICTHSAEILAAAFGRSTCGVFHLRSHRDATKIHERDQKEVFEALRRLGASPIDTLFSRGNLFVEGLHDTAILEEGFFQQVSGYKITDLKGRSEVEKEIRVFQKAEHAGELSKLNAFIFDLDKTPTSLKSSQFVRILQWDRTCLENYLLGAKALYDALSLLDAGGLPSRGEFEAKLKELAISQLPEEIAATVYAEYEPENAGLRRAELVAAGYSEIADKLLTRLMEIKRQLISIDEGTWRAQFVSAASALEAKLKDDWVASWVTACDGKRLIDDLYKVYTINSSKLDLKKLIIKKMAEQKTSEWILIKAKLDEALVEAAP